MVHLALAVGMRAESGLVCIISRRPLRERNEHIVCVQSSLLSLPFDGSYTVTLLILLVVGGVCVGALGSYMGVRRFLSV